MSKNKDRRVSCSYKDIGCDGCPINNICPSADIKTREEKLINDIKTLIGTEKYIEQHVLIYLGIKELVEKYFAEMESEL